MSNSNQVPLRLAVATVLVLLAGCATTPSHDSSSPGTSAETISPLTNRTASAAPTNDVLSAAAAQASIPFPGEGWQSLFDGRTLTGWRPTLFAGRGEVECRSGLLVLNMGDPFTGVNWTNDFPQMDYEIGVEAMRVMGADFFCGLTVPVADSFCSLIVGGWGGSLLGISSLDGADASENETTKFINFEAGRWYRIRLRVTSGRIEGWLDDKKVVDVNTKDKKISLRPGEIEMSKPFGLASWQTTGAFRQIKVRRVDGPADPPKKEF